MAQYHFDNYSNVYNSTAFISCYHEPMSMAARHSFHSFRAESFNKTPLVPINFILKHI